jgi:UDP-glucose 4-epimerase
MVDEFLTLAYFREKELPVVLFRLFNTVGPRQTGRYGMVIPRFVQQAIRGEPLTVYGDGEQSRCFLHVSDAVRAILALADCPDALGQVFNVGSTEEITIRDLAWRVLHTVDEVREQRTGTPPIPPSNKHVRLVPYEEAYTTGFEDMRQRMPDISKMQQYTGWEPQHNLTQILRDVVGSFLDEALSAAPLPNDTLRTIS